MSWLVLVVLGFFLMCAVVSYGLTFRHFERRWPTWREWCAVPGKTLRGRLWG